jgi:hypothetical protein
MKQKNSTTRVFSGIFSRLSLLLLISTTLALMSCGGESDEMARKKLDVILKDDLKAILEGIPDSSIIESPHYKLVLYKIYNEGSYSKKAVADFYFLKGIEKKIVRKYRYYRYNNMWDRYFNEYSSYSDTTNTELE